MKRFLLFILFLLISEANADFSNTISWQGVLVDNSGKALNGSFNLDVSLYDSESSGQKIWTETYPNFTIENGLVNLQLGTVSALNISFNKPYWLELKVGDEIPLSRIPLSAVPYAMYSHSTSNQIKGEPLILRDKEGNIKIKIDPDNGTLQMISNDTVWYELKVQSPAQKTIRHGDGSYQVEDNGGRDVKVYSADGNLTMEKKTEYTIYEDFGKSSFTSEVTVKTYDSKGSVSTIFKEKQVDEQNESFTAVTKEITETTIKDGVEFTKVKESKSIGGHFTEQTRYYYNGNEILTNSNNIGQGDKDSFIETIHYGEDGSVTSKSKFYTNDNRTEVTDKDNNGTSLEQTMNELLFSLLNSNGAISLTPSIDENNPGAKISYKENGEDVVSFEIRKHQGKAQTLTRGEQAVIGDQIIAGNSSVTGNVSVTGNLNVNGTKNFRINHPFEDSKYLVHSAVESNQPLNTYSGNVITDENGFATITLPDYFESVNTDLRYQLTVIGQFAQAIIYKEIFNNTFEIKTNKPNVKVSWEITANRNDIYIRENPFKDVIDK